MFNQLACKYRSSQQCFFLPYTQNPSNNKLILVQGKKTVFGPPKDHLRLEGSIAEEKKREL